ncbi:MAG: zf-HC2 domain-containing protein [Planctomycetota bacterium]|nr:MAG: zf-HC2 domain-containing protein [Planctomycetota bacterium]
MNHKSIHKQMAKFVAGELDHHSALSLEDHLGICSECEKKLEEFFEAEEALIQLFRPEKSTLELPWIIEKKIQPHFPHPTLLHSPHPTNPTSLKHHSTRLLPKALPSLRKTEKLYLFLFFALSTVALFYSFRTLHQAPTSQTPLHSPASPTPRSPYHFHRPIKISHSHPPEEEKLRKIFRSALEIGYQENLPFPPSSTTHTEKK